MTSDKPWYKAAQGAVSAAARTACRWCWRRRFDLGPLAGAGGLTALSWAHYASGVDWYEHIAYGGITALSLAGTGAALKFKNKAVPQVGMGVTAAVVNGWIGAGAGPSVPSLISLAITTAGAYIAYVPWLVRARHERLTIQAKAAKAGLTPEGLGLSVTDPGLTGSSAEETALLRALHALGVAPVAVSSLRFDDTGWVAMVTLPAGKNTSAEWVMSRQTQLSANLGMPGRLRLRVGASDNELVVRLVTSDPLAETIHWSGPSTTSIEKPMVIGRFIDGSPILLDLSRQHTLIGGATDQGKSSIINTVLGNLAACTDVEILGIDMKPGALELGPWRPCMRALADGPEKARQILVMVQAEMRRRGEILAGLRGPYGEPVREWTAEHGKFWVLVIDELAELLRQAPDVLTELTTINQVARALGIRVVAAAQSPSEQAFGGKGTDARQQYGTRIGLRVFEPTPINVIFGAGAQGKGWRLDNLVRPGELMISSRLYSDPNEGRAVYMENSDIMAMVAKYGGVGPGGELQEPSDPDDDPPPDGGPGGGSRTPLQVVPVFPDGSRIPDNRLRLWKALEEAGPGGVTIAELVAADIGYSQRTSVQGPLSQWVAKGWVDDSRTRGRGAKVYAIAAKHAPAPPVNKENAACTTASSTR